MKLKEFRTRSGKTQEEIARIIGIPKKTYQNYEREIREPGSDVLCALADYYDISLDDLMGRTCSFSDEDYEDELIGCYRNMTDAGRIALLAIAHDLEAIFSREEEEAEINGIIAQADWESSQI